MASLSLAGVGCNSDDPNDATEKKVYGQGEAPYLRSNAAATTSLSMEFPLAKIDRPQYINLKDYASVFHRNLDMTVDETVAALQNGDVTLLNINASRQVWDLTPSNYDTYGWYYASNGVGNAENAVFTMEFQPLTNMVEIKAVGVPAVGTMANVDFGFAEVNGKDFDKYVRFTVSLSVTDPSKVVLNVVIPAGGYNAYSINLKDYAESIRLALGMEYDDLVKALENDGIDVYLVDSNGNRVLDEDGGRPGYTSGALGYWLDSDGNITGWSGDGYPANLMFLEYGGNGVYNLGNSANGTPSGTQAKITFDFVLKDNPENFLQFVVAATFE